MGKRGFPPQPTKLRALRGNPGKRGINTREPRPRAGTPTCPAILSDVGKKEWRRITRELREMGTLASSDRAGIAAYCKEYERWWEAEEKVRMVGMVIKTPSGYPVLNPYLSVANGAMRHMVKILAEFGLTPASRTRIQVESKPEATDKAELAARLIG